MLWASVTPPPPLTMSLMQSGYTWRERVRKKGGKTRPGTEEDSFGTAGGLLGYHSLIAAAVAPDVEWPRK